MSEVPDSAVCARECQGSGGPHGEEGREGMGGEIRDKEKGKRKDGEGGVKGRFSDLGLVQHFFPPTTARIGGGREGGWGGRKEEKGGREGRRGGREGGRKEKTEGGNMEEEDKGEMEEREEED